MAYDAKKDKVVKEIGECSVGTSGRVTVFVRLRRYDGGPIKVVIEHGGEGADGKPWTSGSLGRIDADLAEALSPLLAKAARILRKREAREK
jgi:hypothetical protein